MMKRKQCLLFLHILNCGWSHQKDDVHSLPSGTTEGEGVVFSICMTLIGSVSVLGEAAHKMFLTLEFVVLCSLHARWDQLEFICFHMLLIFPVGVLFHGSQTW